MTHSTHKGVRLSLVAVAACWFVSQASAGSIVLHDKAADISIETQDAPLDEVLDTIGRSQGFAVERVGGEPGGPISGRFSGNVREVIAYILQNESYVIEHSATAKAGIVRLLLMGTTGKEERAAPASSTAGGGVVPNSATSSTRSNASAEPLPLPREVLQSTPAAVPLREQVRRPRA